MKRHHVLFWLCTAIAVLFLSSCASSSGSDDGDDNDDDDDTPVNHAPSISSMSVKDISGAATTAYYSDEPFACSVIAYDQDGDALSYQWYLDDVYQSGANTKDVTGFYLSSTYDSVAVKVIVSDGLVSDTETVTLSIIPAASFRIENKSGSTINKVYYSQTYNSQAGYESFSYSNQASSIPNNNFYHFFNFPSGNSYLRCDTSTFFCYRGPVKFTSGERKTWTIYSTTNTIENRIGSPDAAGSAPVCIGSDEITIETEGSGLRNRDPNDPVNGIDSSGFIQ